MFSNVVFLCVLSVVLCSHNQNKESHSEIWDQDISDTFKIDGSDQGIQKVNLKCGSNSMNVVLETENPFTGIMYTRGSFYKQTAPCFVKPDSSNTRSLQMNFHLDQCQTLKEGELYSNIVVIQNDPEVITPGDSAFSLECDFRQPKNLEVEANMQTRHVSGSKITLTSPDPTYIDKVDTDPYVHSNSDYVEYVPKILKINARQKKDIHFGTVEEIKISLEKDEL